MDGNSICGDGWLVEGEDAIGGCFESRKVGGGSRGDGQGLKKGSY